MLTGGQPVVVESSRSLLLEAELAAEREQAMDARRAAVVKQTDLERLVAGLQKQVWGSAHLADLRGLKRRVRLLMLIFRYALGGNLCKSLSDW